jgi:hypothetical protein
MTRYLSQHDRDSVSESDLLRHAVVHSQTRVLDKYIARLRKVKVRVYRTYVRVLTCDYKYVCTAYRATWNR